MEKYKVGKTLGDGTFGSVAKAVNTVTGQVVAIKRMKNKYTKWQDCIALSEIKALTKFHHPNVVNLYELIKHNNQLYFVFEFMERNVYQMMKDFNKPLPEVMIRNTIFQTLQGLAYMHRHGYFHRDLKPENLLQSNSTVKIADFGLAREIRAKPPFTQYVSTRWYRAPEIILRSTNYNSPIDIFAVGAIMAQLYRLWPLFPGGSQRDQIVKICQILGTPSKDDWPEGHKLASNLGFVFPKCQPQNLADLIPSAPPTAIQLIASMLNYNPQKRPTALQALQHPYFQINIPMGIQILSNKNKDQQPESKTSIGIRNARYRPGVVCKLFEQ